MREQTWASMYVNSRRDRLDSRNDPELASSFAHGFHNGKMARLPSSYRDLLIMIEHLWESVKELRVHASRALSFVHLSVCVRCTIAQLQC